MDGVHRAVADYLSQWLDAIPTASNELLAVIIYSFYNKAAKEIWYTSCHMHQVENIRSAIEKNLPKRGQFRSQWFDENNLDEGLYNDWAPFGAFVFGIQRALSLTTSGSTASFPNPWDGPVSNFSSYGATTQIREETAETGESEK